MALGGTEYGKAEVMWIYFLEETRGFFEERRKHETQQLQGVVTVESWRLCCDLPGKPAYAGLEDLRDEEEGTQDFG